MDISETIAQFPMIMDVFFFCIGACIGSFLNVCIFRLPKGESIVSPPSHCACGKLIKWYDNLPIIGWILLRGKARCCKRPISFRYPFVETLTALIFLALWLLLPVHQAISGMVFASIMIFCTFVDIDTMTLPDFATVGGAVVGFILSIAMPQLQNAYMPDMPFVASIIVSGLKSIIGIAVGSGILYWLRLLGECVFKKEAMGEGDVILVGCIGAFCGWQGAVFAIFGGSLIGAFSMIPIVATKKFVVKNSKNKPHKFEDGTEADPLAIPYGPWLALGGLLYYIFLRDFVDTYFANIATVFFGA